ncbi:MAG: hypothetical protein M9895_00270 [Aquamicrobium sp.]|uniref:hypothetical protein n=1 Tax=Aquamicrobium sp. TaxID=1872579 RepID=UPI00349EEFCB|nr:hypothetical protein [Aquamicrobium sp.]
MPVERRKPSPVSEHINRCIELYGQPIDADFSEQIERTTYEQMRADLMLCVGMLMALAPLLEDDGGAS